MADIDSLIQLDDFVSAVLIQIIRGIKDAQKNIHSNTESINPSNLHVSEDGIYYLGPSSKSGMSNTPQLIDFDIAVTASESAQSESKVGAFITVLGATIQGKSDASTSAVSRIKFSVPVQFPTQK